ncbi:molybdopterin molybdotransferase MoeA [Pseudomarimonas arenosa]|uniref:Molybdopterin molybdenumtransferase n=1 Tax=Pseudomarimonas arenosa TaxID=2774145 RepID=A0AAW3ZPL3_9GAMM|nr:gephyrin-like molybdotransferase Glp [Pseudomarimonas arenosa]MBD8527450.1 molybdopterin molybdotransferase MoeA [Pseudomarimonas arenosa]
MMDYADALQEILALAGAAQLDTLPCAQAAGRVLAQACSAQEHLPPFDNTAMDGYALFAPENGLPVGSKLPVVGLLPAGDAAGDYQAGAIEIMTGAPIPSGCNAVIPVECIGLTQREDSSPAEIELQEPVHPGQHVRKAGEDIRAGEPLLAAGCRLGAVETTLLAAQGIESVKVARSPRIAIISTGKELVDDPRQALAAGQIRNSNRPYLQLRAADAGAEVVSTDTVSDDIDAFVTALDRALASGADMIISTGAVSMGRFDFVPEALQRFGATMRFHKTRIRPGKPILFATLPDGQLFFGLPGNPVSSAVGFRFFVEPAIRQRLGLPAESALRLPLANALPKKPPLRLHLKGRVELDAEGRLRARILPGQESFRIRPLLDANCWIVVEHDRPALAESDLVIVVSLCHLSPLVFSGVLT